MIHHAMAISLLVLASGLPALGQSKKSPAVPVAPPRAEFPLWAGDAPGALGKEDKDIPTLTPFLAPPDKATGAPVVICRGGGYGGLAPHEG